MTATPVNKEAAKSIFLKRKVRPRRLLGSCIKLPHKSWYSTIIAKVLASFATETWE